MMLCDRGNWDGCQMLQTNTVNEMLAEQKGREGIRAGTPYGLCVCRDQSLLPDRTVYGHQGISDGVLCNIFFEPQTRLVVVICSNGCHNMLDNRIAHLTRKLFAQVWGKYGNTNQVRMIGEQ